MTKVVNGISHGYIPDAIGVVECQAGHTSIWGLLIIWSAIVGFITGTWFTHEIIGGIVSGVLAAALVLGFQYAEHWRKYRKPWYTEWEPQRKVTYPRIDIEHSDDPSHIQLTLRFRARVHVSHVLFDLIGGGNVPQILELYDWNRADGKPGYNVVLDTNARGAHYWHFVNPLLRTPGKPGLQNTISIGLKVQTRGTFDGHVDIQLAYEERWEMPQHEMLPFHVITKR